eukprot:c3318_g1_i1.p1 GENE.c3318_g1_i1~~c3318_g1_i1.p1  ORF type:complete len:169 (+),score=42.57 c3318_g1_i1:38-544(+)
MTDNTPRPTPAASINTESAIAVVGELVDFTKAVRSNVDLVLSKEVQTLKKVVKHNESQIQQTKKELEVFHELLGSDSLDGPAGALKYREALEKLDQSNLRHAELLKELAIERQKKKLVEAEIERVKHKLETLKQQVSLLKRKQKEDLKQPTLHSLDGEVDRLLASKIA